MQLPAELRDWSYAPGEGEFHVKGIAYAFHMEYVKEHLPGGVEAHAEALDDDELREFFDRTFYATGWYDLYPLVVAGHACGVVVDSTVEEFLRRRTRHQVELNLGLIRRTLARIISASSLAKRVPQVSASYFDFLKAESRDAGAATVEGKFCGLPAAFLSWHQTVTETFLTEVLARGGTPNARVSWGRAVPNGHAHGLAIMDVPYTVSWAVDNQV